LSEKLSIPKPTLRFWEKELDGNIVPLRTPGGQRRYNEAHLAVIKKIKGLREEGINLSEIRLILNNNDPEINNHLDDDDVELLTNRITEIVRYEINRYFQNKKLSNY
jgi:DNA-binding transcriptional MerR regulator